MSEDQRYGGQARPHTLQVFDQELERLRRLILELGEVAKNQLTAAAALLSTRDADRARQVAQDDDKADYLASQVDRLVVRLLALRQPMAGDLRVIVAALKMSADLERIADYAANVAKHSVELEPLDSEEPVALASRMADLGREMLGQAMLGYLNRDIDEADTACRRDDEMDHLYHELLVALQRQIAASPDKGSTFTALLYVGRALERVGDHVTNLCEQIAFQERGES
ncbi:MAG: phosphate signaling complex protein PhoU [Thermodesulfobacteriota bacterium]